MDVKEKILSQVEDAKQNLQKIVCKYCQDNIDSEEVMDLEENFNEIERLLRVLN